MKITALFASCASFALCLPSALVAQESSASTLEQVRKKQEELEKENADLRHLLSRAIDQLEKNNDLLADQKAKIEEMRATIALGTDSVNTTQTPSAQATALNNPSDADERKNHKASDAKYRLAYLCDFQKNAKPTIGIDNDYAIIASNPNLINLCLRAELDPVGGDPTPRSIAKVVTKGEGSYNLRKNVSPAGTEPDESPSAVVDLAGELPGRPLLQPGLIPQLEFSNNSKASLTANFPVLGRVQNLSTEKAAPYALNFSVSLKADLEEGNGPILRRDIEDDTRDLDFLEGTQVRVGLDYLRFSSFTPADEFDKALKNAIAACRLARRNAIVKQEPVGVDLCNAAQIQRWVFAPKGTGSTLSGIDFVRPKEAEKLRNALWRPQKSKTLSWGLGASAGFSDPEFSYAPGEVIRIVDPDDGTISLAPNRDVMLGEAVSPNFAQWDIEGHALFYSKIGEPSKLKVWWKPTGILWTTQLRHQSITEFLPGTRARICTETAGLEFTTTDCNEVQIGEPERRGLTTASLEARLAFNNVPYFGKGGVAPRVLHTFETNETFLDIPIYLADSKDKLSGGVRVRFGLGGNDILGNPQDKFQEIALFFTPLKFDAFK